MTMTVAAADEGAGGPPRTVPATAATGSVEEATAARREQILEAASRALAAVGFEKITTRRIAQEAGVNIATLHYHFGTKEALLAHALQHALYQAEGVLRRAMAEAEDTPAAALTAGFDALWQIARDRPGVLRYDLVLRGLRDPAARAEVGTVYATYRRLVEELAERRLAAGGALAPGVTPGALAHYVVAAVDGVLLQHLVLRDDEAARASLDMIREHALALLSGSAGPTQKETRDG